MKTMTTAHDHTSYFKARIRRLQAKMTDTSKIQEALILEFCEKVCSQQSRYLSFLSQKDSMTEQERNALDLSCDEALREFSSVLSANSAILSNDVTLSSQERQHLAGALSIAQQRLNDIMALVTKIRKRRLEFIYEREKVSTLQNLYEHVSRLGVDVEARFRGSGAVKKEKPAEAHGADGWDVQEFESVEAALSKPEKEPLLRKRHTPITYGSEGNPFDEEHSFTAADDDSRHANVQLEIDNERLFHKFQQRDHQIDHLETQIHEINQLQETFSMKLVEQEQDILHVHDLAVETTENIADGNEWIRKAVNDAASRRVIIIFAIAVLTVALMFIHWYNP